MIRRSFLKSIIYGIPGLGFFDWPIDIVKPLELEHTQGLGLNKIAKIQRALREAIKKRDGISSFFTMDVLPFGTYSRYALDIGQKWYYMPGHGADGTNDGNGNCKEEAVVPTYDLGYSMDWPIHYTRQGRWAVISRAIEVFENGMIAKIDKDASSVLVEASLSNKKFGSSFNNLLKKFIIDNKPDQEKSILVLVYKTIFDDICKEHDDCDDGIDKLDIEYMNHKFSIFSIDLRQKIRKRLWGNLRLQEPVIVAQEKCNGFVMPVRQELIVYGDERLILRDRDGFYGWTELGLGVLNSDNIILGLY